MIGVDWGTTSLRAWRMAPGGVVIEARVTPDGIMAVKDRHFEPVLRAIVGDWLAAGETRIMLSGMIGSRQGWLEAPYLACPAGLDEITAGLMPVGFKGAQVFIVPGLISEDADGVPDVMRGEETQIIGIAADAGTVCLPGTHSKWARIAAGRIARFTTYMTGEIFAALVHHTILARTMKVGPVDPVSFDHGVAQAAKPGGLLHHAFGARTRVLRGGLSEPESYGYLSGLVIGEELNTALRDGNGPIAVVGAAKLAALYARAIVARGSTAIEVGEAAGAAGLALLGERAPWI